MLGRDGGGPWLPNLEGGIGRQLNIASFLPPFKALILNDEFVFHKFGSRKLKVAFMHESAEIG